LHLDSHMKVLQLGKFYPIGGGIEKVMYDLLVGLSERDIPCDMLCAYDGVGSKTITITDKNRIFCVKTWMKKYATMVSPAMVARLRKIAVEYDIIHVHHPDPMAALALWLSGYKGKVVLHWHSDIVKQKKLLSLYLPLQGWLIRRADLIVGTTPVYLAQSSYLADVQEKCAVMPIGIDSVKPDATRIAELRHRYEGKKIVFSLGRLVHYKGYRYLIDAAKQLDDSYVVLIGGSGALRNELQKQIDDNHLTNRVKLLGRIPEEDLPAYYGACDVYCLSSIMKTEAFAIVQIEAMSCGKPVVCCDIEGSGVSWVNKNNYSGIVVEPENANALADAIRRIVEDKALYYTYSAGARSRFVEFFKKSRMIDRCLELYQQVLA